jgi:hypothetical protein
MPQRRHTRWMRNLLCAAALAAASLSLAADLPLKQQQPAPSATNPMTPPDGEVSCSNVGIACVPKAMQCAADAPTR